jgi:COP9 signalosome complex subunit 5
MSETPESKSRVSVIGLQHADHEGIFDEDEFFEIQRQRPWANDPYYFRIVHISAIAAMKMLRHALSGGNVEVMGLIQGTVRTDPPAFWVVDVFELPVEGTETRVDAQADGYEYTVQYLSFLKHTSPNGSVPPIIGWYHSHPNYGCWLSGIDISNQRLHQSHEEPYLAIVIDPIRSKQDGRLHIGAFRTLPLATVNSNSSTNPSFVSFSSQKNQDHGIHKNEYYELEVFFKTSALDEELLKQLNKSILADSKETSNRDPKLLSAISKYAQDLSQSFSDSMGALYLEKEKIDNLPSILQNIRSFRKDLLKFKESLEYFHPEYLSQGPV